MYTIVKFHRIAVSAICFALASLACERALSAQPAPEIRLVAAAGQSAPGSNRAFGNFIDSPPSVNILGDVVFRANYVHQGPEGIWADRGAGLQAVAINGQAAPGILGRQFEYFGESNPNTNAAVSGLVINNLGQIAFRATLAGGGYFNSDGLWLAQPDGSLQYIARSGATIPGGSSSVVQIQHENVNLNHQGVVTFRGRYTESYNNNAGVWTYQGPGQLQFVGQTLDPVPEDPSRKFAEFAYDGAMTDAAGRTFFNASPGTTTGGSVGEFGLYASESGSLRLLASHYLDIPELPGVRLSGFYPFNPAINLQGQYAFATGLSGTGVTLDNDLAIFRGSANGIFEPAVREGDQAPGMAAGVVFSEFHSPEINAHGQLAFIAFVRGPGVTTANNEVVWVESTLGEFIPVAREGQLAPDAPNDGKFGPRFGSSTFRQLAINARGQVAFHADFLGSKSGDGIWATDPAGDLKSIVLTGVPFEVASGNSHTVLGLAFAGGTGNDEGRPSGFSDAGHVAFTSLGGFQSPGIYLSSKVLRVPEPGTVTLLAVAILAGSIARGRWQSIR